MPTQHPVLIVGAGPAGLTCALTLLKHNVPVRIIEQSDTNHVGTRGAGIMPRSLELFQSLGVLPELQRLRGLESPTTQLYENGAIKSMPPLMEKMDPAPSKPFQNLWFVSQADLEEVFRKELQKYGCSVELGVRLIGLEQDQTGVTAHISHVGENMESYRASYLVGADGAKGITRKLIECHFLGEAKDDKGMLVGNVVINNLNPEVWHIWKPSSNSVISLRPYDKVLRKFVITVTGIPEDLEQEVTPESFQRLFRKYTRCEDPGFGTFEWLSYFKPKMMVVDKMSKDRVFLAGDAAHVHPPHGGQGLNTSVQDSFNLSWKLALVYKGFSPISLLDSYDAERLPVITEMLKQVIGIYNKSDSDASAERATPARGKHLYMLGINYRWSPIILPRNSPSGTAISVEKLKARAYVGWDDEIQPGDRAPDCPGLVLDGEQRSLFQLLTPTKHTALVFAGDNINHDGNFKLTQKMLGALRSGYEKEVMDIFIVVAKNNPQCSSVFRTLVDVEDHAHAAYGAVGDRVMAVVIRPDGIVGAMVQADEALKDYMSLVFKSG